MHQTHHECTGDNYRNCVILYLAGWMARDHGFRGWVQEEQDYFHFTVWAFVFVGPLLRGSIPVMSMTRPEYSPHFLHAPCERRSNFDPFPDLFKVQIPTDRLLSLFVILFSMMHVGKYPLKQWRCWIQQSRDNRLTKSNETAKPWILLIVFFLFIFISLWFRSSEYLLSQQRSASCLWIRV